MYSFARALFLIAMHSEWSVSMMQYVGVSACTVFKRNCGQLVKHIMRHCMLYEFKQGKSATVATKNVTCL
jgi:hypothetical protein